jgi:MFS family permease
VSATTPDASIRGVDPAWRRTFLTQLLIAGLSVTAIQAGRPMITYRALDLGAGPLEIGLITSAFSVLPVITAVAVGRWVDRIGEAWFLVGAMALITVGCFISAGAAALIGLGIANAVTGFGQITSLVSGQAMIGNRGPRDGRAERYGWYATVASLGQLLGPALAALLVGGAIAEAAGGSATGDATGNPFAPVFLVGGMLGAAAMLLALTLPRRGPARAASVDDEPRIGLLAATRQVLRRPGMVPAMLVSITVISAIDVLIAYLPVYGSEAGLSVETVALLLSVRAGASLVSRVFMTQLMRWFGRPRLLAISMISAAVSVAMLPLVPPVPVLFALMVVIGLGLGLGQPMTIAWVADRSPRQERALALGVRLTGNRAALLVVPTLMGAIAGASGITTIWIVLAGFLGYGANVARRAPFDEPPVRSSGRPGGPTPDTAATPDKTNGSGSG